jgi:hypothetical protein
MLICLLGVAAFLLLFVGIGTLIAWIAIRFNHAHREWKQRNRS